MISQTGEGDSMRSQGLRQQRVFVTLFQGLHRRARKPLCLAEMPFGQKSSRAGVVYLGKVNIIIDFREKVSGAVQMVMRVGIPFKTEEQKAEIILHTGLISGVTGLVKVETGS